MQPLNKARATGAYGDCTKSLLCYMSRVQVCFVLAWLRSWLILSCIVSIVWYEESEETLSVERGRAKGKVNLNESDTDAVAEKQIEYFMQHW